MSPTPRTPDALQAAAVRFLRRFGVVAAGWATLLALSTPAGVERPAVLWGGMAVLWTWALTSQGVAAPRAWWAGWFVVALGVELLGPLAGTNGSSLAGGVSFVVLAGVALSRRRWWVIATVAVLAASALVRPMINDAWSIAGSVSTVLLFVFGGLALTLVVETVALGLAERDRLTGALADAERQQAVTRERAEAAARLHDSVLQTLTAIGRADDPDEGARLARRASSELRDFLRRSTGGDTTGDLGDLLRRSVTAAADGGAVGVSVVGQHVVTPTAEALVDAVCEAVRNALAHGAPPVRVLLERDDLDLVCWVSDRGPGFDLASIPDDRLGVRRSVIGRVESVGGTATLDRTAGCEWRLAVPAPI